MFLPLCTPPFRDPCCSPHFFPHLFVSRPACCCRRLVLACTHPPPLLSVLAAPPPLCTPFALVCLYSMCNVRAL
ncbi:hypothetical protein EON67_04730 [archaeon]|nr:MAG: hypothetical protein EON67_04730 [archaeon]